MRVQVVAINLLLQQSSFPSSSILVHHRSAGPQVLPVENVAIDEVMGNGLLAGG